MPERIGPYRIDELLGSGGMGEVYRAYDEKLARPVAIKLIHVHRVSLHALQRFRREARIVASLAHPNIVQIYHVEQFEGDDCIVMELIEGRSLAQRLRHGPLEAASSIALARQLARGLAAAHGRHIIHRDLKPANVMLTEDGTVKILDFGLARPDPEGSDSSIDSTPDNMLLGTPRALAPEQVQMLAADERSDLFSYGTLLYEVTTGRHPFAAPSALKILHQICYHRPPAPRELNPTVPAELSHLIQHLMEKDPNDRPQSVIEVLETLDRVRSMPASSGLFARSPRPGHDERRQITFLRCLLSASPEVLDHTQAAEFTRRWSVLASEEIRQALGRIHELSSEHLFAFFGYPRAREDDARRAVEAAFSTFRRIREELLPDIGDEQLVMRAGVYTDVVLARQLGRGQRGGHRLDDRELEELRQKTIDLMARCPADAIVASGATRRLIERSFICRPLSRDLTESAAYEVRGRLDRRGSPRAPGLSTLIGRRQELGLFAARWRLAREGRGQTLLISGETGLGKTHLVMALREHLDVDDTELFISRCAPRLEAQAFRPVIALVWQALGTPRDMPPEESLLRLHDLLIRFQLEDLQSPLASLLGLTNEPLPQRQQSHRALLDLVLALALKKTRIWIVEDLQWVDPATLELLLELVRRSATMPLFLVMTCRPGFQPPWEPSHATRLALERLPRDETRDLLLALDATLTTAAADRLTEISDGIPLFVEELARHAGDVPEGPASAMHPVLLPTKLREIFLARLDNLETGKDLVHLCAVVGQEIPMRVLRQLAPHDERALQADLHYLTTEEILHPCGLQEPCYVFQHSLLRQAAYEAIPEERRRQLAEKIRSALNETSQPSG